MSGTDRGEKFNILVFTLIEVLAVASLGFGLALALGVALRFALFTAEHVVSYNAKRVGRSLFELHGLPLTKIAIVAAVETATWEAWFNRATVAVGLAEQAIAAAILAGGLLVGHIMERNTVAGLPLLRHPLRRINESLDFTGVETVIGVVWLLLLDVSGVLAAAALTFGLFAEHSISFRREVEE